MNYYERHVGDYARDTGHLSLVEHGVFTLMLDRYYATEKGIPDEISHKICHARTREERRAVESVLKEFFTLVDGVWINERADREIAAARARIDSARENGKKGGRPRKNPAGSDSETQPKPNGFPSGSENETGSKAHQSPSTSLHKDQEQSSTASPSTDLLGQANPPADLKTVRAQRLAQVTDEAIAAFNASQLVKANGGVLACVSGVGREKRQQQVSRCLRVARDICVQDYQSQTVTPEFWTDYWAACLADDHKSGRRGGGRDHPNWKPTFEYLTREATMLEVYDRASGEGEAA